MSDSPDYLDAMGLEFSSREDFVSYLNEIDVGSISGEFNIMGAVNNLPESRDFLDLIQNHLRLVNSTGELHLLRATVDGEKVYHYLYMDEDFPIFFTTANKTDQIPPTVEKFLQETKDVGRLMLSRRQIDNIRKNIVSRHEDLLIPYFSARRSRDSSISAKRRPDVERSVQYRADDGLETYREMRFNYGVLPKIMVFERPNHFKFRVKQEGMFVLQNGTVDELWAILTNEMERAANIVEYSNTGGFKGVPSSFFEDKEFHISSPWAIELDSTLHEGPIKSLPASLSEDFWEFGVSEYDIRSSGRGFDAEVIDENTHERTVLRSKGNSIRVFPREETDIDQSVRLFNFVSDHFDSECKARRVE